MKKKHLQDKSKRQMLGFDCSGRAMYLHPPTRRDRKRMKLIRRKIARCVTPGME